MNFNRAWMALHAAAPKRRLQAGLLSHCCGVVANFKNCEVMMRLVKGNSPPPRYKLANLAVGDILFCTNPRGREAAVIRRATNAPFSHAAIYKGELNFLEAADHGVQNFNHMRFGIISQEHVQVRRLSCSVAHAEALALAAANAAEKYRERDYWTPGAVFSAFKALRRAAAKRGFLRPSRRNGFFCSYLVAQSYLDAGIALCPGLEPCETHPGDLLSSPYLYDVTSDVVVSMQDWDKRSDAIDGHSNPTPYQGYAAARRKILEEIRPILARAGLDYPVTLDEAFQRVILDENRERQRLLDDAICECLERNDYVNLIFKHTEVPPADDVAFSELPLDVLKKTLLLHVQLRDKWRIRQADYADELQAAAQLKQKIKLKLGDLCEISVRNKASVLDNACRELDETIVKIEQLVAQRDAALTSGD